jgi:YbbR domain-containing protein
LFVVGEDNLSINVQLKIRAPQSIWQNLTQSEIRTWIDLSSYLAGVHQVPIQVEILEEQTTIVEVIPPQVTVQLEPLTSKRLPVTVQIQDSPSQGYFNRLPVAEPISVTVKGASTSVAQVEQVIAEISLNNSKETLKQVVSLSPYNAADEIVQNTILDPPRATITVPIEQRFGYKDVSVKAKVVGQPAAGYWVNSISLEPATVTLVGGPSVLKDVTGFVETVEVDLSGAVEDVVKRVPLDLPLGASIVVDPEQDSEGGRSILVTVGISALTGGRTIQTGLTVQGVRQDLNWVAAPETVEIILSGPLPILQNLTKDDVAAILDLFGLTLGVHRLQPEIVHPDGLEITGLIPETIEVTLKSAREATPAFIPTARPTPTPMVTSTATVTPTAIATPTEVTTTTDTISTTNTTVLSSSLEITPTLK